MFSLSIPPDFWSYFRNADDNAGRFWRESESINAFTKYHSFFVHLLEGLPAKTGPAAILASAAFTNYLAAVRVAASGHPAAVFPLLRVALEGACYAFLMVRDQQLADLWVTRDVGDEQRRAFRRRFDSAVKQAAAAINELQAESGDAVTETYDLLISWGAHPNFTGLRPHLTSEDDRKDGLREMLIASLYEPDDIRAKQGVAACLDVGWVIALVLARTREELTEGLADGLTELNTHKEAAVAAMTG